MDEVANHMKYVLVAIIEYLALNKTNESLFSGTETTCIEILAKWLQKLDYGESLILRIDWGTLNLSKKLMLTS